jgi:hypothetical protein
MAPVPETDQATIPFLGDLFRNPQTQTSAVLPSSGERGFSVRSHLAAGTIRQQTGQRFRTRKDTLSQAGSSHCFTDP